jgi:hypothetical protein
MAYGALTTQILCVGAQLGLAECLAQIAPATASELAPKLGVDAATAERLLHAFACLDLCNETEGSRFMLTPLGEYLRPDHPDSVSARVLLNGQVFYRLWGELLEIVRTGESGSQRIFGMPFYDYLVHDPAVASLFDQTMAGVVRHRHKPVVEAYNFDQFKTVVDIGGGNGALLAEILKAYSRPTGIIFDLPRAATAAIQTVEKAGLTGRCSFIGGDAFQSVPIGANAYVLANFVVSWGDDRSLVPLRHCREAIAAGGTLLLVEWVMPSGGEPYEDHARWDATVAMDINMLAIFGGNSGRVRTRAEFAALLGSAGFELTAVIPTRSSVSIIEAKPAQ